MAASAEATASLESAARSIALELSARGVKPGDRVGVFLDRSVQMIAGLLGSHWAGAAYVPLDPGYPQARNRDLLEDADVAAVLTTSALARPSAGGTVGDRFDVSTISIAAVRPPRTLPESLARVPRLHPIHLGLDRSPQGRGCHARQPESIDCGAPAGL